MKNKNPLIVSESNAVTTVMKAGTLVFRRKEYRNQEEAIWNTSL